MQFFDSETSIALTILLPIIATILSILAFLHSKREVYAPIIASNRFNWMNDMREKYACFLKIYCDASLPIDKKVSQLIQQKAIIELYFDNRFEEYSNVSQDLSECIKLCKNGSQEIPDFLLIDIQKIFSSTHKRAKREAGITKSMECKMRKEVLGKEVRPVSDEFKFYNDYYSSKLPVEAVPAESFHPAKPATAHRWAHILLR